MGTLGILGDNNDHTAPWCRANHRHVPKNQPTSDGSARNLKLFSKRCSACYCNGLAAFQDSNTSPKPLDSSYTQTTRASPFGMSGRALSGTDLPRREVFVDTARRSLKIAYRPLARKWQSPLSVSQSGHPRSSAAQCSCARETHKTSTKFIEPRMNADKRGLNLATSPPVSFVQSP
jgi:hypothetical protein